MKVRPLLTTAAWLLLTALCLNAQSTGPESRWVAGIGFGFSTNPYTQDSTRADRNEDLVPVEATLEYRLSRWFSITTRFSFGQMNTSSVRSEWLNEQYHPFLFNYRIRTAAVLIAPQAQFRIWQGDLGLSLGLGRYRQWYDQKSYGADGRQYHIKYRGVNNDFFAFRTDYTYWPRRHFGISIGLEATESFGGPGRNSYPAPRPPLPGNLEPEGVADVLQPRVGGYGTTTIWAGFRYRF